MISLSDVALKTQRSLQWKLLEDKISNIAGFINSDAQRQTQESYCRLIRCSTFGGRKDGERIRRKRGWDYESPYTLLSPLLACLSMTTANTVPEKSLKLCLETFGRLLFPRKPLASDTKNWQQAWNMCSCPPVTNKMWWPCLNKHYSFRIRILH